jgi:nicotinate-nucleotide adenylyltransferase
MIDFKITTALIGGSFDPVHAGHLAIAREIRRQIPETEQIVFVPAALSPGKVVPTAAPEQRLHWLRAVVEPEGFKVWDWELKAGGESFTANTLAEAHRQGSTAERLYWVVGADAYAGFPSWREPGRIRELCRLLVVNRPGHSLFPLSVEDRILSMPPHPASSTNIRAFLAAGDFPGAVAAGLPPALRTELEKALPPNNPYARKIS